MSGLAAAHSFIHRYHALPRYDLSGKDAILIGISKNGKVMGRPTDNPKTHVARLRLSEDEKEKLDECCRITESNITDVLKLGIDKVYHEAKTK